MILNENEINQKLSNLRGWEYANNQISKTYTLKDFESAMRLVNQVAMLAENLNHHPDMDIRYSKVAFHISTHSEGGVTEKDFNLAKKIESTATGI
jgi:4a-hydroxytetrahydrobiopterin dehydratase